MTHVPANIWNVHRNNPKLYHFDTACFTIGERKEINLQKYLYVVLSQTTSVVARSLKKVLKNQYTHMSLSFNKELTPMFAFARLEKENPFVGGPNTEELSDYFFGKPNYDIKIKVYKIPMNEEQCERAKAFIMEVFNDKEGYRYNWLEPLEVLFKKPVKIYKTYVCSAFVYDVLKTAGLHYDKELIYFISPEKLGHSLSRYLYYSGPIMGYPHFNKVIKPLKRRKIKSLLVPVETIKFHGGTVVRHLKYKLREKRKHEQ